MGGLAAAGEMQGVGEVHTLGMPVEGEGYGAGIFQLDLSQSDVRIPRQGGHRFHAKLDSDSTASWTPVPGQAGHLK